MAASTRGVTQTKTKNRPSRGLQQAAREMFGMKQTRLVKKATADRAKTERKAAIAKTKERGKADIATKKGAEKKAAKAAFRTNMKALKKSSRPAPKQGRRTKVGAIMQDSKGNLVGTSAKKAVRQQRKTTNTAARKASKAKTKTASKFVTTANALGIKRRPTTSRMSHGR